MWVVRLARVTPAGNGCTATSDGIRFKVWDWKLFWRYWPPNLSAKPGVASQRKSRLKVLSTVRLNWGLPCTEKPPSTSPVEVAGAYLKLLGSLTSKPNLMTGTLLALPPK